MGLESTWVNGKIAAKPEIADAVPVAVTFTSGSAPATDGAITIANSATPTVVELLALIYEVNAKLNALVESLQDG